MLLHAGRPTGVGGRGASELNHDDPSTFSPPASFGPFRVLHQIGSGVLGPVFRTYEPERDRLIAVKAFRIDLLPEQSAMLADQLQRIVDAGLSHQAIVQMVAAGIEGHLPYLAQEYIAAESLDIAMKHIAPAMPDRVLPFLEQLAGAIDEAVAAGLRHGALHPRDIFVTTDEARATGFGIVQAIENIGFRAPTRRPYTAPERVEGDEWDSRADVYSLAAIAHELLTGRRPAGPGDQDGSFAPDVPAEYRARLRDVLARALAENPAGRHPSATAFVDALRAASEGRAVDPPPSRAGSTAAAAVTASTPQAAEPRLFDSDDEDERNADAVHDAEVETIDDIEDEGDIEDEDDVEDVGDVDSPEDDEDEADDENAEAFEDGQDGEDAEDVEEGDADADEDDWPPAGFSAADPDVIVERETDAGLSDFDLDLNRLEPGQSDEAVRASEVRELEPAEEHIREPLDDESLDRLDAAYETDSEEDEAPPIDPSRPVEPAFVPPPVAPAASRVEVPGWQASGALAAPASSPGGNRSVLWMLAGVAIGFVLAWLWFGGTRGTERPGDAPAPADIAATGQALTPSDQTPASDAASEAVSTAPPTVPVDAPPTPAPESSPTAAAAPSARTPGASTTSGRLLVRSVPSNAMVVIDGVWSGRTPFTKEGMTLGTHTVRVVHEGYEPMNRTVTFSAENPSRQMTFELVPTRRAPAPAATGTLSVSSRPAGARVFVDDRAVGTTPLKVPNVAAGSHRVRIELPGYRPWSTTVDVARNQDARVAASLERQ